MKEIDFNRNWTLYRSNNDQGKNINLPFDAMINTKRNPDQQTYFLLAGFEGKKCTYKKTLNIKEEALNQDYLLEFEGIYCDSTVLVNKQEAKKKLYGYTPFTVNLSKYLHVGNNEIEVIVDVPKENHGRWYTGEGIYRPVHLYVGKNNYLLPQTLQVSTLEINPAKIKSSVSVKGTGILKFQVLDLDGKLLTETTEHKINSSFNSKEIIIDNAKLWSADDPNLYQLRALLFDDHHKLIDSESTEFGIREIKIVPNKGLFVNGKHVFLKGGCIHNDNGVIGVVNNEATEFHRAKILKESGFNAIRSSHHPMARSLMKACDHVGLYVMDEAFDYWYRLKGLNPYNQEFLQHFKGDVKAMVQDAYNHPSVLMYSIGNEIPEAGSLKGVRVGEAIIDEIHKYDRSRLTILSPSVHWLTSYLRDTPYLNMTEDEFIKRSPDNKKKDFNHYLKIFMSAAANIPNSNNKNNYPDKQIKEDEDATNRLYEKLDLAGYNYYGDKYETLHKLHPDRLIVGTETRAGFIVDRMHFARKHPYVIGNFVWTLQDHLGEVNCSEMHKLNEEVYRGYPWLTNYCGVIDLIGNISPEIHRFEFSWNPHKHGIYLASQVPSSNKEKVEFNDYKWSTGIENWSYPGLEGKPTWIDVYTDAYKVKLYLNDKLVGISKPKDYYACLPVNYEPGTLTAIGVDENEKELYRTSLVTAGTKLKITANADRTILKANGNDFAFIKISVTDKDGNVVRCPEHKIKANISGPATLAGFGSSNPMNEVAFNLEEQKTYLGQLMLVIRTTSEKGKIIINLQSDNDLSQKVELLSE